jgi:hypothetical protein
MSTEAKITFGSSALGRRQPQKPIESEGAPIKIETSEVGSRLSAALTSRTRPYTVRGPHGSALALISGHIGATLRGSDPRWLQPRASCLLSTS